VTGLSATGSVSQVLVWGRVVPTPGTSYTPITPAPGSTWTEITPASGTSWTEIAA